MRNAMTTLKFIFLAALIVSSSVCLGQIGRSRHFSKWGELNGLCSRSLLLDSLGYFFKEEGCEGRSFISFGHYQVSKSGILTFSHLPADSLHAFQQIRRTKGPADTVLTLTFYDRYGKLLRHVHSFQIIDNNGKQESVWTDNNGQIILDRRLYKDVLITPLIVLFKQQEALVTGEENVIDVFLDLPTMFLMYSEINFERPKSRPLVLKKDGLYEMDKKAKAYDNN
jgi:hypothetical protein